MENIPRCKKHKSKPVVLSKEEVIRLIDSIANLKHRTLVSLMYPSGLRISEVLKLKLTDIDKDRMQVFVRDAKGKKDRYTILSKKSLELLQM
jgi:site-specific recombinase XerD